MSCVAAKMPRVPRAAQALCAGGGARATMVRGSAETGPDWCARERARACSAMAERAYNESLSTLEARVEELSASPSARRSELMRAAQRESISSVALDAKSRFIQERQTRPRRSNGRGFVVEHRRGALAGARCTFLARTLRVSLRGAYRARGCHGGRAALEIRMYAIVR